jgi:hypothetical protein
VAKPTSRMAERLVRGLLVRGAGRDWMGSPPPAVGIRRAAITGHLIARTRRAAGHSVRCVASDAPRHHCSAWRARNPRPGLQH